MRALVLADTHLVDGLAKRLPEVVLRSIGDADCVLHAGDVTSAHALEQLAALAPLHAVLGNNDHELVGRLPETLELELEGVRVAMLHDSGPRQGREARLARVFPSADLVVFGHSHIPHDAAGLSGQWLFNPGSPTTRRNQPRCSYGWLEFASGRLSGHRLEYC